MVTHEQGVRANAFRRVLVSRGIVVTDPMHLPPVPGYSPGEALHLFRILMKLGLVAWNDEQGAYDIEPVEDLEPNGGYYVWVIGADGQPLPEGPYGPHDLDKAKALARIGATEGQHNRAVSRGLHPTEPSFELVREYEAGSGERLV